MYLGGNEQSTHKYASELLGKETIDTNTYGKSSGRNGNYSTNYQISGRELLMPDEVRMLDNRYAILFMRGERPVKDLKYDILKHPNVKYSADGNGKIYVHGKTDLAIASITMAFDDVIEDNNQIDMVDEDNYMIIFSDDIDDFLNTRRVGEKNEKEKNLKKSI